MQRMKIISIIQAIISALGLLFLLGLLFSSQESFLQQGHTMELIGAWLFAAFFSIMVIHTTEEQENPATYWLHSNTYATKIKNCYMFLFVGCVIASLAIAILWQLNGAIPNKTVSVTVFVLPLIGMLLNNLGEVYLYGKILPAIVPKEDFSYQG